MDLEQILAGLSIIVVISAIVGLITKRRSEEMIDIKNRLKALEESDVLKQLAIVKIEATLESLTQAHEKTQTLITTTTSELICTIREMSKS